MKGKIAAGIGALLFLWAVFAILACSKDSSPTGPDVMVAPEPLTLAGNAPPAGNNSPTTEEDSTKGWINMRKVGDKVIGDISAGVEGWFGLACYTGPMNDPSAQTLVGKPKSVYLKKGRDATIEAPLGCGVRNQCDFHDEKQARPNGQYGKHRIAGDYFQGEPCEPPPPPPGCKVKDCKEGEHFDRGQCKCIPDQCVVPPEPQCEYGPALFDKEACEWECPPPNKCEDQPKPDCPEQEWLPFPDCKWVGECEECDFCVDSGQTVSCEVQEDTLSQPQLVNGASPLNPFYLIKCDAYASHSGEFLLHTEAEDFIEEIFTGNESFTKGQLLCGTSSSYTVDADVTNSDECEGKHEDCGTASTSVTIPKCEFPCEPPGPPECDNQVWDTDLCAYVGDCICEPDTDPECDEQTWDTDLCIWVGECEPDYCFYEVTGSGKSFKCEYIAGGDWENWDNEFHRNHCRVEYPGISLFSFNLTPGQSETGCLKKPHGPQ